MKNVKETITANTFTSTKAVADTIATLLNSEVFSSRCNTHGNLYEGTGSWYVPTEQGTIRVSCHALPGHYQYNLADNGNGGITSVKRTDTVLDVRVVRELAPKYAEALAQKAAIESDKSLTARQKTLRINKLNLHFIHPQYTGQFTVTAIYEGINDVA